MSRFLTSESAVRFCSEATFGGDLKFGDCHDCTKCRRLHAAQRVAEELVDGLVLREPERGELLIKFKTELENFAQAILEQAVQRAQEVGVNTVKG